MWIKMIAMFCTIEVFNRQCFGMNFIDLPAFGDSLKQIVRAPKHDSSDDDDDIRPLPVASGSEDREQRLDQIEPSEDSQARIVRTRAPNIPGMRRHWLVSAPPDPTPKNEMIEDKDASLKSKINMLVQQTMHDTELKVKSVQKLKEKYRESAPYKIGFVLSMIKKSRDVLNELFNVAVKHRDEWKALEQLKIFELIVHTNVDTTNLVRQLVEIHIGHINETAVAEGRYRRHRPVPKQADSYSSSYDNDKMMLIKK